MGMFFPVICYRVRDIIRASSVIEGIRNLNLAHAYSVVVFIALFSVASFSLTFHPSSDSLEDCRVGKRIDQQQFITRHVTICRVPALRFTWVRRRNKTKHINLNGLKKHDIRFVKQKFNTFEKDRLWCYLPLLLSPYVAKSSLSKQQHQKHHQYHLPAHLLRILQQRWWII
jgi:hypothetical protein